MCKRCLRQHQICRRRVVSGCEKIYTRKVEREFMSEELILLLSK